MGQLKPLIAEISFFITPFVQERLFLKKKENHCVTAREEEWVVLFISCPSVSYSNSRQIPSKLQGEECVLIIEHWSKKKGTPVVHIDLGKKRAWLWVVDCGWNPWAWRAVHAISIFRYIFFLNKTAEHYTEIKKKYRWSLTKTRHRGTEHIGTANLDDFGVNDMCSLI